MNDEITNNDLQDDQEAEAVETISLTDFPITQDHRNPPSPPPPTTDQDFFEFFHEELSDNVSKHKTVTHAEDIIFCGKLIPINEQNHRNKPPHFKTKSENDQQHQPIGCRRSRSESMAKPKTTNVSPLVRTSRSLDYKRLNRNSSMSSEPSEISREGSGKKSTSSRWYVLLFGLVKVPPPEMDIKDIRDRQVRRSSSESFDRVSRSVDHRKCSWRVLGFLSCKSASSAAVATPVGYMAQV